MDNFDLKQYLVENKVTRNSRLLAEQADVFSFSNDLQAVINQLIQMGPKGKQVLTTLQSMGEWNDLVQTAVDEESVDSFNTSNDLLSIVNQLIRSGKKDILNVLNSIDAWQDLMDSASMAEAKKPKNSRMMKEYFYFEKETQSEEGRTPDSTSMSLFLDELGFNSQDDLFSVAINAEDVHELINMMADSAGGGVHPFDGVLTQSDFIQASNVAGFTGEMIEDILDRDDVRTLERG
jgi:hypothetical protein